MATEGSERQAGLRSFVEAAKNWVADVIGTSRSRFDVFTSDVEERLFRFIARIVWTAIAFISLSLGLLLAMLTVVFGFDLPPRYALGIPAVVFLLVGLVAVWKRGTKERKGPRRSRARSRD
ncbi:MAG TPA: phage holin family protein [Candidatus Krumholzibacteria bacterium]|nr:phage holin family protein [Candidatus Krumholzibacteria bacterium]